MCRQILGVVTSTSISSPVAVVKLKLKYLDTVPSLSHILNLNASEKAQHIGTVAALVSRRSIRTQKVSF